MFTGSRVQASPYQCWRARPAQFWRGTGGILPGPGTLLKTSRGWTKPPSRQAVERGLPGAHARGARPAEAGTTSDAGCPGPPPKGQTNVTLDPLAPPATCLTIAHEPHALRDNLEENRSGLGH